MTRIGPATYINTSAWENPTFTPGPNGQVYIYAPMNLAQVFHIILVIFDLLIGLAALILGIFTLLKKPVFAKQALVHKHLGRLWVIFMTTTAYESTWAVEVGTPYFIVYLMTALYTTMLVGMYIIRVRGDLKEDEAYAKREKLMKGLKIAHAVFMAASYFMLLSGAFARFGSFASRYGATPFKKSPCIDYPEACVGVPLCYPMWMNVTSTAGLNNIRPYADVVPTSA